MLSPVGFYCALFLREAVRSLARNRLRSALTALGITIGVSAVVLVVAVGQAGSRRAEEELRKLGDNLIWVEAGTRQSNGVRSGSHGATSLTIDDYEAIRREVPLIRRCSPQVDGNVSLIHGNRNWSTRYRGETPDYLDIKRYEVAEGDAFSDDDVERSASRILIGRTVRDQLFESEEHAVGSTVRMQGQLFEVVGVLGEKGQSADGRDQDDWILLPHTTAQTRLRGRGIQYLDDILCSATAPAAVNPAIDGVIALMRQRHHIAADAEDDFNIRRPDEILKAQVEASDTLGLFLVAIASISLLVGGIGIMNVMLASVAQRTREIGLRVAVGATASYVLLQFLGEAVVLSVGGGVLGMALTWAGSSALSQALGWPILVSPHAVAVSLGSATFVGVLFGFYPAWRAAQLDPIIALRHE